MTGWLAKAWQIPYEAQLEARLSALEALAAVSLDARNGLLTGQLLPAPNIVYDRKAHIAEGLRLPEYSPRPRDGEVITHVKERPPAAAGKLKPKSADKPKSAPVPDIDRSRYEVWWEGSQMYVRSRV